MKRIKHSKYKNTGLIFELLVRQVASDTMHNRDSVALNILKKHFSNSSELSNELKLYRSIQEEKFANERKAELFLEAVVAARHALNETKLRREKYNLVKDIFNRLNGDEFFKARISTYKQHAAVYKLFEYTQADDPRVYVDSKYMLIEFVQTQPKAEVKPTLASEEKDIRILASKLIIDKFNEKYSNLTVSQKRMLREYINNVTNTVNLKDHIVQETKKIESAINQFASTVSNKITRIKLNEVTSLLKELRGKHTIQDKDIVTMLRYYELVNELKKINKAN
jgi:hypothetical protein